MPQDSDKKLKSGLQKDEISNEDILRATVKVVETGIPIDQVEFPESEIMRELVRTRLLMLVGLKPEEKKTREPSEETEEPKKPQEPTIEPEIPKKKTFDFPGSYGPDAPDVKKIAKAHKDGYPIAVYEFMQGMVDYGKGHQPPPRIWVEHKSGKRYTYEGNGEITHTKEDPVTAIEFINGGSGMPPEDILINRHKGEGTTLGEYGKGLSLALAYVTTQGMVAKPSSYHEDRSWSGETYLTPTESNVSEVLAIRGEWGDPKEEKTTKIRIENPTDKFIKEVSRSSDFFLYANPRFADATIVEPDNEAQAKIEKAIPIDRGKVTCLDRVVSQKDDGTHNSIFVDGLRVPLNSGQRSILPWSIQGLGKSNNHGVRVSRSHNSMSYEAFEISTPVLLAVQQLESEDLLRRLIKCAMQNLNTEHLEFRETYRYSVDMSVISGTTAELTKKIWRKEYGENTIIATSEKMAKWYKKFSKDKKEVKLIPKGLYGFLERAGVPTVESETAVVDVISFEGLNDLNVPSANAPDKFDRMMNYIAQIDGEAKLVEDDTEGKIVITIPKAIRTIEEFNGQTEYSDGIVMRTVATIACSEGLNYKIFAIDGDYIYEIIMKIGTKQENTYSTQIEIQVIERSKKPEYEQFEDGKSYMILSGDGIAAFCEADPAEKVATKKESKTKKKEKMPQHDKGADAILKDVVERTVVKKTIGQIAITNKEESDGEIDAESRYPNNYYQRETGSTFLYDEESSSGYWNNEYNWAKEEVSMKEPESYYSAHVITDLRSRERQLLVPVGYKITGIKKSPKAKFTVYRDERTGQYLISGIAKRLVYYTGKDKESKYDRQEPLVKEKENLLERTHPLLLPEWREFIETIKANPALSTYNKVALAQEIWNQKFVYDDDYGLNDQIKGKNVEEVAAKIVNTSRGICNLSATGFAILLRAIGVPARVSAGYWKQSDHHGGKHMWIEYWNGTRWIPHETEVGIKEVKEEGGGSVGEVIERLKARIKELLRTTEELTTARTELKRQVNAAKKGVQGLLIEVPLLTTRKGFQTRIKKELGTFCEQEENVA